MSLYSSCSVTCDPVQCTKFSMSAFYHRSLQHNSGLQCSVNNWFMGVLAVTGILPVMEKSQLSTTVNWPLCIPQGQLEMYQHQMDNINQEYSV